MAPPEAGFEVTVDDLYTVAMELSGTTELMYSNVAAFSGVQDAISDQARGFDAMRAAAECESSWQRAIQTQAARLAVDGDTLDLNAATYAAGDAHNARTIGGR